MPSRPRNFPRFGQVQSGNRLDFARPTAQLNMPRSASLTFLENTTWAAPAGKRILRRLIGKGQDGTPATGSHNYRYGYTSVQTYSFARHYNDGRPTEYYNETNNFGFQEGAVPADYCTPISRNNTADGYVESAQCWQYTAATIDAGNYTPPTTGAASVAFDRVFAGGPSGNVAVPVIFNNLEIIAGTNYSIIVPAGGYVTIEY